MNFIPAKVAEDGRWVLLDLPGSQVLAIDFSLPPGHAVLVGIRPEHLKIASAGQSGFDVSIAAVESTGATTFVTTATTPEITFVLNERSSLEAFENVRLTFEGKNIHVFDAESEQRLGT